MEQEKGLKYLMDVLHKSAAEVDIMRKSFGLSESVAFNTPKGITWAS